jgi:methionyl-tRNA formyltransferase
MARVVYMGAPPFSVPALRVLREDGYDIVAVVTQPDRPAGRSGAPHPTPLKEYALQHGLPVWQPERLRGDAEGRLRALGPDVVVVAAYGEILRPAILAVPAHGCLNIHASLLPRHRGAAPIAAAILAGDAETGVSLMKMDAGMDSGPMLAQEAIPLRGEERQGDLTAQLAELGAGLLRRTLPAWLAGAIRPQPQDESRATCCRPLRREDGRIDWTQPAAYIERMIRAYDPWPGAYTTLRGRRLHIWRASVIAHRALSPGTVARRGKQLVVGTGDGGLVLEEVQLEGKRRLAVQEFIRGQHDLEGSRLG